jgi:hypothetical protein
MLVVLDSLVQNENTITFHLLRRLNLERIIEIRSFR